RPKSKDFTPNLHEVWDDEIIKQMKPADLKPEEWTAQKIADSLDERFKDRMAAWSQGQIEDWAREAHEHAKATSYGQITPPIAIAQNPEEPKRCDAVSDQFLALKIRLGSSYEKAAEPVVQGQLAKAGFRLARLLNEAAGTGPSPKVKR